MSTNFRGRGGRDRGRGRGRGGGRGGAPPQVYRNGAAPAFSARVASTEDAKLKSLATSMQDLRLDDVHKLPKRPGYGTRGRPITLWANYFELQLPKTLLLYRYAIEIAPGPDGKKPVGKKLKWCIQLLLEEHFSEHAHDVVTDFSSTIISKKKLTLDNEPLIVHYKDEGADQPRDGARIYQMRLKPTESPSDKLQLSDLVDYVTSTNAAALCKSKDETIQSLNIILGHYLKTSAAVRSVGANKHFPTSGDQAMEKFSLGRGLEAFRGFFVSVRAATERILLNIQVKHVACYEAVRLDVLIDRFNPRQTSDYRHLENFIKKLPVKATHITRRNSKGQEIPRMKTIVGFAKRGDGAKLDSPPQVPEFAAGSDKVKFWIPNDAVKASGAGAAKPGSKGTTGGQPLLPRETRPATASAAKGKYITVAEYFRLHYDRLKRPELPVLNVGTSQNPNYLPPEVCIILLGQPYNGKLSPEQTTSMIHFAVRQPHQNADSITLNGARLIGANPPMQNFGLSMSNSLITVPGRVLPTPSIVYRGKKAETRSGSWSMVENRFTRAVKPPAPWSYLWLSIEGQPDAWNDHNTLIDRFHNMLKSCGIDAPPPLKPGRRLELSRNFSPNDETLVDAAIRAAALKLCLLIIILPKADTAIYNRIKSSGDIQYGIHTLCVVGPKFARVTHDDNAQYLANVALKLNLKLGGINQSLEPTRLGIIEEGKTMVVGLDVTHPSPGSVSTAPSVAGIVASVDKFLGQWPADVRIQVGRKEMVEHLAEMFKSRLRLWHQKNNFAYPQNILIYRDGVSEGQYKLVLENELPEIRRVCTELYPATDTKAGVPHISIIIVGKRHNTRFYPTKVEEADRSGNPQNGTVVDRGVTEVVNWDFFLQAHTALQGTARPAHYYVILDEIFTRQKIKAPFMHAGDMLEDLTHNMCYMFGRATKAVSICPPAYYADLVCDRARRWLSGVFETSMAGSSVGTDEAEPQASDADVRVHERLKNTMFYV